VTKTGCNLRQPKYKKDKLTILREWDEKVRKRERKRKE